MNIKLEPTSATSSNVSSSLSLSANNNDNNNKDDQNRIAAVAAAAVAAAAVVAYNNQQHEQKQRAEVRNNNSTDAPSSHQHLNQQLASSQQQQRNFTNYNYSHMSEPPPPPAPQLEYNSMPKTTNNLIRPDKSLHHSHNHHQQAYVNNLSTNENESTSADEFYDETHENNENTLTTSVSVAVPTLSHHRPSNIINKNDDSLIDEIGDVDESDDATFNEPDTNKNMTNNDDDLIDNDNLDDDFDDTGKMNFLYLTQLCYSRAFNLGSISQKNIIYLRI